jgi:hypothetical protein
MLQRDVEGSSVAPPPESRSSLLAISSSDDREADDALELVEQLDMPTSALREESRAKRETVVAELAATEAQTCLVGKAFGKI